MNLSIDPLSPIPLYHQIAEALSYRIATGRLSPGDRLPTVRAAAAAWQVNMHTVRRAYAELAQRGLVEIRRALGARVLDVEAAGSLDRRRRSVSSFLRRVVREAQDQHDLTRADLARLLTSSSAASAPWTDVTYVVECSETQCADHVREVQSHWEVEARPWRLAREGEPPAGPVVATYFHYNDVRRRWPHRLHEIRFAAIQPDPQIPARLERTPPGKRMTLTLCEFDEPMARNIAADLSVLLPAERYRIKTSVVRRGGDGLGPTTGRVPVLFPPRVWDTLSPAEREDPRACKVTYVFTEEELENMGEAFGWRRRSRLVV